MSPDRRNMCPVLQESGTVGVQGKEFYRELTWNRDNIEGYSTKILAMKMLDNERAEIRWSFAGSKGLFGNLSGEVNSTIFLNVLTGRVEEHSDVVSLGGNPLAQLWYKVTKLAWGSKLKAKQVGGQVRARFVYNLQGTMSELPCFMGSVHVYATADNCIFVKDPLKYTSHHSRSKHGR